MSLPSGFGFAWIFFWPNAVSDMLESTRVTDSRQVYVKSLVPNAGCISFGECSAPLEGRIATSPGYALVRFHLLLSRETQGQGIRQTVK